MTEHTPGPWDLIPSPGHALGDRWVIVPESLDSHDRIAVVSLAGMPRHNLDVAEANAWLIAAAPDLLEACETALLVGDQLRAAEELFERSWNVKIMCEKLQAAIAKAKGTADD